jgi:C4-dicarboxylate-specific signal transduction histidine kinase
LRRWKIPETRLPSGSVIEFRQPTFWERYRWRIVGLLSVIVAEAALIVLLVWNLVKQRRTERETHLVRQELTHISRVATMGELTASIAHELNQPLMAILSNAQAGLRFMASGKADPDELRDILKDIVADDQRAGQVIRHLRSLLKKSDAERRPLELNNLIHDVVAVVRSDAVLRNVSMELDLAPRLPVVRGDRVQLQQVILNLVVNAFDAMTATHDRPRRVVLRTRASDGDQVQLDVVDNGPGIPAEKLGSIFEPFFTTKSTGMGMGLSVSRSIMNAHDGQLWAENNPDGGAAFHVALPAMPGEKAS